MSSYLERNLIIGLITSTDFIKKIEPIWNLQYIKSSTAKRIAIWCMEYYRNYNVAPGKNIESIFYNKAKNLQKGIAQEIEEDILPSLSDEYENSNFNLDYLVDETKNYFNEQRIINITEQVSTLLETGQIEEAEKLMLSYKPVINESKDWVDLSDTHILEDIDQAFEQSNKNLIKFSGALGEFWNDQMTRDSFIAIMGSEKRGKTFMLLEFAMKACKQGRNVAFFQAGDMSKNQQLKRIAIYLAQKSDNKKYCGKMFEPVKDCIFNQLGTCSKKERQCTFGVFEGKSESYIRNEITIDELKDAYLQNLDYVPCTNCEEYTTNKWGISFLEEIDVGDPLTKEEAKHEFEQFFIEHKRQFKLSSHPSGTLTVKKAKNILDIWEMEEFIADVIIFDYPDIMDHETVKEYRHKQNAIWMEGRGLAQEKHALVIWVTQADADSYTKDLLTAKNFSEDKRKFAHPTAFYGLNQDPKGREKGLGIIRINEIVIRGGDSNINNQVYILQNLRRGRPIIASYF